MADVSAYGDLAAELAASFTVFSAERRGRELSPRPYRQDHDLARDVEDVDAILHTTGANLVFGLSSGAVITLEAARILARVAAVAVYEPPFYPAGIDREGIERIGRQIESGNFSGALLDALRTARTGPTVLGVLPRLIGRVLTRGALAVDDRRHVEGESLRELLPGVRYDFHDVAQVDGRIETYAQVDKPVLLLSGTKSPAFLRQAIGELHSTLPCSSTHIELKGLSHDGPWNDLDHACVGVLGSGHDVIPVPDDDPVVVKLSDPGQ